MAITILAAGSLRSALLEIMDKFQAINSDKLQCHFGPAGILRHEIENGAPCDLFLSANEGHPQALFRQQRALFIHPFIANQLCLTTTSKIAQKYPNWLSLLADPSLSIAASTPIFDPGGDYAMQLISNISARHPNIADNIRHRIRHLVGGHGNDNIKIPVGNMASKWIVTTGKADIFIGYQHYKKRIEQEQGLSVIDIPADFNVTAIYTMALLNKSANAFMAYLTQPVAENIFLAHGFMGLTTQLFDNNQERSEGLHQYQRSRFSISGA